MHLNKQQSICEHSNVPLWPLFLYLYFFEFVIKSLMCHHRPAHRLANVLHSKRAGNHANASETTATQQTSVVLPQVTMSLAGVNGLNDSSRQSKTDATSNLESRVDHATAQTLDIDRH